MVQGPSLTFAQNNPELYHRKKKVDCEAAKRAHEKIQGQLEADSTRALSYYLLVFPPNTLLDNSIFSSNNFDVKENTNGMKMLAAEEGNEFNIDVTFMAIWWQIAKAGGDLTRAAGKKAKTTATDLFD